MVRRALSLIVLLALAPGINADIFTWRDESGRVHFGDREPDNRPVQRLTIGTHAGERLRITEHHRDFEFSNAGRERIERGIRQIFDIYTQSFALDVRGRVEVNLHLFNHQADYRTWLQSRLGRAPLTTGAFLTETNEVGVWRWGNENQVINTILHEASHVILHQLAPTAPVWLHEGLAQYFEGLREDDQHTWIEPNHEAMARIRTWISNNELISIRRYLSIPEPQWVQMAHDRDAVPYTIAWGLVYFLMSRPVGEQTIRRILHDLEKSGLPPTLERINSRYPGGILQLEYEFFRWAQSEPQPHRY